MTVMPEWIGAAGAWAPFAGGVVLKSAVVLLVAFAVTLLLRQASASVRHHVWTMAFATIVALPLLSVTLPAWEVSLPGWTTVTVAPAGQETTVEGFRGEMDLDAESGSVVEGVVPSNVRLPGSAGERAPVAERAGGKFEGGSAEAGADLLPWPRDPWTAAAVLWLLGVSVLLAHLAIGVLSAWWVCRRASPVHDPEWLALVSRVKEELGIASEVALRRTSGLGTPTTWGILRPVLLVPDDALGWSAERRRAVVLHELAHVRRRDCLIHLLTHVGRAIHWINPLAWVGAKRIRNERERACDDLVLRAGTSGPVYAELLLDVARAHRSRHMAWGAVSMARPSQLEGRVLAILDPARDRRSVGRAVSVGAFLLAAATALPLAAVQAVPDDEAEQDFRLPPVRAEELPAEVVSESAYRPSAAFRSERIVEMETRAAESDEGTGIAPTEPVPLEMSALLGVSAADTTEERLVSAIAARLTDERVQLRSLAARTLGNTESSLAVAPLVQALDDESVEVREQIVWALGQIESRDAVEGLLRVLSEDGSTEVREQAAWALGMIEDPAAVDGLAAAVRGDEGPVREQAVWALGMIESPEGVEVLVSILADDDVELRKQAAWALGMIESPEATEGLVRVLREDGSAEVREQAAWALGMIEDSAATEALIDALEDESPDVAEQAMWALGQVMND